MTIMAVTVTVTVSELAYPLSSLQCPSRVAFCWSATSPHSINTCIDGVVSMMCLESKKRLEISHVKQRAASYLEHCIAITPSGALSLQEIHTNLFAPPSPNLLTCLDSEILSKTLTQQTGSGMAQLCMWQLVVGFNLREMEAREDMRKNFNK